MEKMTRNRSAANITEDRATTEGGITADPRNPNATARPKRVPMGKGMTLDVSGVELDRENYHYQWITEKPHRPGRLQQAKAAFYEHVTDIEGNQISRPSAGSTTYLMRLPMEYWIEDKQLKKDKVKRTLEAETKIGVNEYAPTSHNRDGGDSSIVERREGTNPFS